MVSELADSLSIEDKENASIYIESCNEIIEAEYENEFIVHLFQNDGYEVNLQEIDQLNGKKITDYKNNDLSTKYEVSFLDEESPYTLCLSRNQEKVSEIKKTLKKVFPSLCVVILILAAFFAFFFSWYIATPIKVVSKIAKQMAGLDFDSRFKVKRSDEIGILQESLNELSQKLDVSLSKLQQANERLQIDIQREKMLERQRLDFFSAASHELKTPITIIKGQLQGMLCQVGRYKDRDTYLAQSIQVTESLEKIVQELLTVSRLERSGYVCAKAKVDFSHLLQGELGLYEDLFLQKNMELEMHIHTDLFVNGDAQLLKKVIDNLVSNAIQYSPEESTISIRLVKEVTNIIFSIDNSDTHIPEEEIPKLFEAFYRVEQSRNRGTGGSGLGLYIVKTILDFHDAAIKITNTAQGVRVTIQFRCSL